ncbi:AlpA family transcriptional regulator [Salmonella enterica subsp. diarizonae]|uniref:AlpA family transcriptional regulator n=1 Tax=Salmonella diarizonae TaxID=59204 RepID=A0A6C8Y0X3_SALDZ|nr:AlpA family transcriptional regulator [Salmonella enterica subsp. diarizonae]HDP0319587.1 AlpA family transcriptional regulator [Salmonella enterica subsp. enterica serovar Concord]
MKIALRHEAPVWGKNPHCGSDNPQCGFRCFSSGQHYGVVVPSDPLSHHEAQEDTVTLPSQSHRLLRLPQILDKTGLKRAQVYAYMKTGDFPKSVKIGPSSVAWLESEIDDWINEKLNNR